MGLGTQSCRRHRAATNRAVLSYLAEGLESRVLLSVQIDAVVGGVVSSGLAPDAETAAAKNARSSYEPGAVLMRLKKPEPANGPAPMLPESMAPMFRDLSIKKVQPMFGAPARKVIKVRPLKALKDMAK